MARHFVWAAPRAESGVVAPSPFAGEGAIIDATLAAPHFVSATSSGTSASLGATALAVIKVIATVS